MDRNGVIHNKDARKGYGRLSLSGSEMTRIQQCIEINKKTLGKDISAFCSPLSGSEMTRKQNALKKNAGKGSVCSLLTSEWVKDHELRFDLARFPPLENR